MDTLNPQTPIESTPEQPLSVPPKSSSHSKPLMITIVFIVIMIGLTSYFLASRAKPTSPINVSPTFSQPTPIPDPTANWKTYTSAYGFTFKYPSAWKLKTQKIDEGVEHDLKPDYEALLSYDEPNQPPHGGFSYGTIVTILKPKENKNNLSARQWAGEIKSWEKIENLTVQGIESVRVIEEVDGLTQTVYIPYKGMIYQITSWSFATTDIYEKEFYQILSTFRFLDQNQVSTFQKSKFPPSK